MRAYNWEKINELIQPLMEVMQKDYPNDAELVITSNFAKIHYVHTDLNFMRPLGDNPPVVVAENATASKEG